MLISIIHIYLIYVIDVHQKFSLNCIMKKIILSMTLLMMSLYAETPSYYQVEVLIVSQGGDYTYLEVKEKTFWVAVNKADVKVSDYVRFQKEPLKNYVRITFRTKD